MLGDGCFVAARDIIFNLWFYPHPLIEGITKALHRKLADNYGRMLAGTVDLYGSVAEVKRMLIFTSSYTKNGCPAHYPQPKPPNIERYDNGVLLSIRENPQWDFDPRGPQVRVPAGNPEL